MVAVKRIPAFNIAWLTFAPASSLRSKVATPSLLVLTVPLETLTPVFIGSSTFKRTARLAIAPSLFSKRTNTLNVSPLVLTTLFAPILRLSLVPLGSGVTVVTELAWVTILPLASAADNPIEKLLAFFAISAFCASVKLLGTATVKIALPELSVV